MYPPLFREQIWKYGFWRYQNHLFLKLAVPAMNSALGWILSVERGVIYFSEHACLLSSARNHKISNVVWRKLKLSKGKSKQITYPDWQPLQGAALILGKRKCLGPGPSDHCICPPASLQSPLPMLGDYRGCSLAIKGTGAAGASLRWLSQCDQNTKRTSWKEKFSQLVSCFLFMSRKRWLGIRKTWVWVVAQPLIRYRQEELLISSEIHFLTKANRGNNTHSPPGMDCSHYFRVLGLE